MDKDEFFDVYRQFCPTATREEYDSEWDTFQMLKAQHEARKKVQ